VAGARSLALDGSGNLYTGYYEYMNQTLHSAVYASGWTVTPLPDKVSQRFPIALSSTNRMHMAYWTSGSGSWELRWAVASQLPEVIDSIGNGLGNAYLGLSVTPPGAGNPDGQPHVLYAKPIGGGTNFQIIYATRNAPTFWDKTVIDTDELAGAQQCYNQPQMLGETCAFDYYEVRPLGVASTPSGEVRLFYQKVHRQGSLIADCPGGPPICYWMPDSDSSTGDLMVAWIEPNQTVGTAVLADKFSAYGATLVVDTIGHIHLAAYSSDPALSGYPPVRYLQFGP
jgi:hypothetical protein